MDLISVRTCKSQSDADQHAFVLKAMGIRTYTVQEDYGVVLYVEAAEAVEAARQLAEYDEEEARRLRPRPRALRRIPAAEAPLVFVAVLTGFFVAQQTAAFGLDWLRSGAAQSGMIIGGEWWRTVTSLFLHADGSHLLGNLGMGIVVGLLLAQILGSGVAWLAILVSGILGNALNAAIQLPGHTAIGASTAVFGGIGMLAGFTQLSSTAPWHRGARRWAPAGAGLALLVLMGTAGEKTDILAHVGGFIAGGLMGLALGRFDAGVADRPVVQAFSGVAALGIVAAAWLFAFRT